QRAGLGDRPALAVRAQRAHDAARAQVQCTAALDREASHVEASELQRVAVADGHRAGLQPDLAAEVVVLVGQGDARTTRVDLAGPGNGQRSRLADRPAAAVDLQVAEHGPAAQAQGPVAGDGQRAGGERPQRERADVVDGNRATSQRDRAGEAVVRVGQDDVARAGIEARLAAHLECAQLPDAAGLY